MKINVQIQIHKIFIRIITLLTQAITILIKTIQINIKNPIEISYLRLSNIHDISICLDDLVLKLLWLRLQFFQDNLQHVL
jgi:hypothetical protein